MALMETFKDNFDFGGLDSGKWTSFGGGITAGTLLNVSFTTSNNYIGIDSLTTYDLTASYMYSQIVDAGNQSLASFEVYPVYLKVDANNNVYFRLTGGQVSCWKTIATVNTQVGSNVAYNSTTMKYFKIREAAGTIYWDYAADPQGSWTNITSFVNVLTITAMTCEVLVGTWNSENSTAIIDNVNTYPTEYQFTWQGLTWNKRIHAADPALLQTWSASNVGTPDANDYLTLSLSNAGSAPIGCEIFTNQRGFGYGTYTFVVATRLDNAHAAVGFGGAFTFDFTASPDYKEIDMAEIRPYAGNPNKRILYNHVWNNGGSGTFITDDLDQASDTIQTHQCVWTPTKITYKTFTGEGVTGTPLNNYTHETHIPTKGIERVHFNIFVDVSVAGYADATAIDVVIRKFYFEGIKTPTNMFRRIKVADGMSRSEGAT